MQVSLAQNEGSESKENVVEKGSKKEIYMKATEKLWKREIMEQNLA